MILISKETLLETLQTANEVAGVRRELRPPQSSPNVHSTVGVVMKADVTGEHPHKRTSFFERAVLSCVKQRPSIRYVANECSKHGTALRCL